MPAKKVAKNIRPTTTDKLPVSTQEFQFSKASGDRTIQALRALAAVSGSDRVNVFHLDQLRLPRSGTQWRTSGGFVPHIDGVIIHHHRARNKWNKPYDPQSSEPPDCVSPDGVYGYGDPGGDCYTCPFAKFGPDGERPKCRGVYRVYIITAGAVLPTHLSVPATSISSVRDYLAHLARTYGYFSFNVVTRFSLEEKEEDQAPIIRCEELASLPDQMVEQLSTYATKLRESVEQPTPPPALAAGPFTPEAIAGPTAPVPLFSEVDDEDDIPDVALPKE